MAAPFRPGCDERAVRTIYALFKWLLNPGCPMNLLCLAASILLSAAPATASPPVRMKVAGEEPGKPPLTTILFEVTLRNDRAEPAGSSSPPGSASRPARAA